MGHSLACRPGLSPWGRAGCTRPGPQKAGELEGADRGSHPTRPNKGPAPLNRGGMARLYSHESAHPMLVESAEKKQGKPC